MLKKRANFENLVNEKGKCVQLTLQKLVEMRVFPRVMSWNKSCLLQEQSNLQQIYKIYLFLKARFLSSNSR